MAFLRWRMSPRPSSPFVLPGAALERQKSPEDYTKAFWHHLTVSSWRERTLIRPNSGSSGCNKSTGFLRKSGKGVSSPCHSVLSLLLHEPMHARSLSTYYAKTLCQRLLICIRVKMCPLQLRWAKENTTLHFPKLTSSCFQPPSPRMV